jgi:hypothetical protein
MQVASEDYETIGVERPCNDIYCTMRHVSREEEIDTYWCLWGKAEARLRVSLYCWNSSPVSGDDRAVRLWYGVMHSEAI